MCVGHAYDVLFSGGKEGEGEDRLYTDHRPGKSCQKEGIFFLPGKSATALELLRTMPTEDVFTPHTSFFLRFCSFFRQEQKLVYESFFTFALMWTLGGAVADARAQL